jgi:hypothetical protein
MGKQSPFLLLGLQVQLPYIQLVDVCVVILDIRIAAPLRLDQSFDHLQRCVPSVEVAVFLNVSVSLIHHVRGVVSAISELDRAAGELVVIASSQDEERLHDVSQIDDEHHAYLLHVSPDTPSHLARSWGEVSTYTFW